MILQSWLNCKIFGIVLFLTNSILAQLFFLPYFHLLFYHPYHVIIINYAYLKLPMRNLWWIIFVYVATFRTVLVKILKVSKSLVIIITNWYVPLCENYWYMNLFRNNNWRCLFYLLEFWELFEFACYKLSPSLEVMLGNSNFKWEFLKLT